MKNIPFNKPYMTGNEISYIREAYSNGQLSGNGHFTKKCHQWLEKKTASSKALLTHSCTAALEMAAILANIQSGDEVIMPSYTFVSTANAFVLRGGVPIFVDIRSDTMNLNEMLIEDAITSRTKAIVPIHYAGVGCKMDTILAIATKYNLIVIEDAAQGVMSSYKGRALGSIGHLGCYSFHETKNVISGEGGALLVNDPNLDIRADIIREKGTDRSRFFRGEVDKYTWQEIGSSFLPSELTAAFLWAQLEEAQKITDRRIDLWNKYHQLFEILEQKNILRRPTIPQDCMHNAHMYYVLLDQKFDRQGVIIKLKSLGINAVFHYVPLHSSPAGRLYGRVHGAMTNTNKNSSQLLRLPLWDGMTTEQIYYVFNSLLKILLGK
jgi:dTDP-4-amino-4,6-dideoxygalactose transaminase